MRRSEVLKRLRSTAGVETLGSREPVANLVPHTLEPYDLSDLFRRIHPRSFVTRKEANGKQVIEGLRLDV